MIAAEACLLTVLVAILRRGETATALRQNSTGNSALVREFRELLERRYREGWTVAPVTYWLGFQDPACFTRFFTRICNESPSKYREQRKRLSPADASRSAPAGS